MDWFLTTIYWYLALFLLGILFFPLTKKFFSSFVDQGYAFSKTIAILVLSYTAFVLGVFKILPFTQLTLIAVVGIFGLLNLVVLRVSEQRGAPPQPTPMLYRKSEDGAVTKAGPVALKLIIFEELLFLVSLLFLAFIRGQEPSIRGLEKFMDFGFMNSILRSSYFPPLDMWLSGFPVNYYYFGHLTGAYLIKLTGVKSVIGYNLILATIFAQGATLAFSLVSNIINSLKKIRIREFIFFGLIGAFIVNLAGNLHTIYLFTKGYHADSPVPFWTILSNYNPARYWYPNATRFIPFTIHEFPSYSYVVADLHGHVFDIPFVLLTLALLFVFFFQSRNSKFEIRNLKQSLNLNFLNLKPLNLLRALSFELRISILFGFMTAVHYMTNAFDGPIYILLVVLIASFIFGFSLNFWLITILTSIFFIIFSLPFSVNFQPFVSGIGLNCSPAFLVKLVRLGPFLFEGNNCQVSALWMLFILWGFFWINFILYLLVKRYFKEGTMNFLFILFSFGTILILIPEFFYIKDIYPAHFRANTMFKLGYQAFMIMGVASSVTIFLIKGAEIRFKILYKFVFFIFFCFIVLYPFYAFPSYYGKENRKPELDGGVWMKTGFKADHEIIGYLNKNITGQPTILEAPGDSYTDYERISSYTGLPTIAGWLVHEWLWRGSPDVVNKRLGDIQAIYESADLEETRELIKKYGVKYIVVSGLERQKYPKMHEDKFRMTGTRLFISSDGFGALYQAN